MWNKRGITPLVATVLLVAFSVGLGALVMSWGEEYIEQKAEFAQGIQEGSSGCSAVELSLIKIGGLAQSCYTADTVELWLDNGPNIEVFNVHARLAGKDDVIVDEEILDTPLAREDAAKVSVPISSSLGQILQVRLTPKIYVDRQVQFCSEAAITVERIPPC